MKIHYTFHALERMKQRGVDRELVESFLEKPDRVDKLNDVYRCVKRINEKVLVASFIEELAILHWW